MEKKPLDFIWGYCKLFKWYLISMILLVFLQTICSRFSMLYSANLYDFVAGKTNNPNYWSEIIYLLILVSVLMLLKQVFLEITFYFSGKVLPRSNSVIIRELFEHVNKHSIAFFTEEMSGNVSNKMGQISSSINQIMDIFMNTLQIFMSFFVAVFMLAYFSMYFAAATLIWAALVLILGGHLGKNRRKSSKDLSHTRSKTEGMIVDSISNYSEIKSFANYHYERRRLGQNLRKLRLIEVKDRMVFFFFHIIQNSVSNISIIAFAFLSVWLLKTGKIDTAGFIFANTLFTTLSFTIYEATYAYNNGARIFGTLQSALDTLAVEPEIIDKPNAKDLRTKKAEISFEGVTFAYKGKKPIFKNLNLEIKAGEKVGLVGSSGAGKSTFIKLISRYFDIQEGSIKINGTDIREITQNSLHRVIATIPQDVNLFNRSLMENIRYGKVTAKDEEVIRAAKKAHADEFIKEMPNKYQTTVGERGVVLSGGERQRIAIARVILKNSPILVFDEATSALDSKSERYIQSSLKTLMNNKTVVVVAHRLSTLRDMDRIVVFDKGQIVEQGSHNSLLRKKGAYYKLYNMQADGFLQG